MNIDMALEDGPCRITVGSGILDGLGELLGGHGWDRFAIVTDRTVSGLLGHRVRDSLQRAGLEHFILEVPDTHRAKTAESLGRVWEGLMAGGMGRDSCVMGLGGGSVGDIAGLAAATYMRGIGLVQVPTTLLAQIDSSIGGKSGLDLPGGKNMVGAFHQPRLVVSDISVLGTLPARELRSGLAEAVKYGIIADPELFSMLEDRGMGIMSDAEKLVAGCCSVKAGIVEADERERGRREILNLGHTLGHALEVAGDYRYNHGEAVSVGMSFAAGVSVSLGRMGAPDAERITELLGSLGLPVRAEKGFDAGILMQIMARDKKRRLGRVRMVLPTGIGSEPTTETVDAHELGKALAEALP